MNSDDRRAFQRLNLGKPILATIDGRSALIVDVGMTGAFVEHHGKAQPGMTLELSFKWQGAEVRFVSEVMHSRVVRTGSAKEAPVSQSGIKFIEAAGDAEARLQDMMATFVGQLLAAQKSNAKGDAEGRPEILSQLGEARRSRSRGFLAYRLSGGKWTLTRTESDKQPGDGFTVAGHEDEEELATLCRAYEVADEEGRRLIRLVAELSVHSAKKASTT